ncbi:protein of unknown function [Candidatus Filomicrobium marinum]|uniref:Uncharacterized protein n=1 Tax=Candidatus Filomicrobium marinum TaxID=1608628 RepID=A0A0D6JJK5_9HYPH|nr:protein of unknown function [Candidatus Filomicrobium marinum]CPR21835.1 protein of unknown function [Candidatus Filomicrobium marinum]
MLKDLPRRPRQQNDVERAHAINQEINFMTDEATVLIDDLILVETEFPSVVGRDNPDLQSFIKLRDVTVHVCNFLLKKTSVRRAPSRHRSVCL